MLRPFRRSLKSFHWIPEIYSEGPWVQNYFYNNTKILFSFSLSSSHAYYWSFPKAEKVMTSLLWQQVECVLVYSCIKKFLSFNFEYSKYQQIQPTQTKAVKDLQLFLRMYRNPGTKCLRTVATNKLMIQNLCRVPTLNRLWEHQVWADTTPPLRRILPCWGRQTVIMWWSQWNKHRILWLLRRGTMT